jgi:hypothetical protein
VLVSGDRVEGDSRGQRSLCRLNRQRLARFVVAVLLLAQLIGSVIATVKLGWAGLGMSVIAAPVVGAVALSYAAPFAIALAALGFAGFALFSVVHWIIRGPTQTDADTTRHNQALQHIEQLEEELGIGLTEDPEQRPEALLQQELVALRQELTDLREDARIERHNADVERRRGSKS